MRVSYTAPLPLITGAVADVVDIESLEILGAASF
uniref:Uncharacterized protein n=1 Tax=Ralstonia solanacearum TaxID=305 RepID=A0A0S4TS19_RALSL|nr:protein of unknown function [Ralstonia solanacearum]